MLIWGREKFVDSVFEVFQSSMKWGCKILPVHLEIRSDPMMMMKKNRDGIQPEERIVLTSPGEATKKEKDNMNPKKAPGYDLITGEILKNLPRKSIVKLTNLINADFKLRYVPRLWKIAEVMMIVKPLNEVSSYRPISLLTVMSKLSLKSSIKTTKTHNRTAKSNIESSIWIQK